MQLNLISSEVTRRAAAELLKTDVEMLHRYPEEGRLCVYCGAYQGRTRFDEECPALLRCAVELLRAKTSPPDNQQ